MKVFFKIEMYKIPFHNISSICNLRCYNDVYKER